MGNTTRARYMQKPRATELLCCVCNQWKPDSHYLVRLANKDRRARGTVCAVCRDKRKARYVGSTGRAGIIDLSGEFPTRPPEMQGAGTPVFTPWVSKVRA